MVLLLAVCLLHWLNIIFTISYPYIIPANDFDKCFLAYMYMIAFHWVLLKGECFITYVEKKILNFEYQLGDCTSFSPHLQLVAGKNKRIESSLRLFIVTMLIVSVVLIVNRQSYLSIIAKITLVIIYLLPALLTRFFRKRCNEEKIS